MGLKDIMLAINKQISLNLGLDVDSKNLEEEFDRPSVRTNIDNLKTSAFMQSMKERNFIVRIYYFPKNITKNKIELMEIQEKLETSFFNHLKIKDDFFIYIDEIEFNETDGVLVAEFEVMTMEEIVNDIDLEYIEELTVRTDVVFENTEKTSVKEKIETIEELAEGYQIKYKFN